MIKIPVCHLQNADSEMGSSKLHGFQLDADYPEASLGSREAETGYYTKGASYLMSNKRSSSGKPQKKVKGLKRGGKKKHTKQVISMSMTERLAVVLKKGIVGER